MMYEIENGPVLVAIDRTGIVDISIGDSLHIKDFSEISLSYTWTQQDSELVENNPDAEIYLKIEKGEDGTYRAGGLEIR